MLVTVCVVLSSVCAVPLLGFAVWLLVRSSEKLLLGAYLVAVLGMVFEMWLAQLWAKEAAGWKRVYDRDTGELQKQLQQLRQQPSVSISNGHVSA